MLLIIRGRFKLNRNSCYAVHNCRTIQGITVWKNHTRQEFSYIAYACARAAITLCLGTYTAVACSACAKPQKKHHLSEDDSLTTADGEYVCLIRFRDGARMFLFRLDSSVWEYNDIDPSNPVFHSRRFVFAR